MTAVRFTNASDPGLTSSTAQARFTYRLTKYASVHAGYRRRLGQYDFNSTVQDARIDDYDLGVDYNRVLSLRASRNTTLSFTTGSSIYKDFDGRHYAATGSANLEHRVGRTGRLSLVYARGVGFVEGLLAPVFTDSVTATAGSALSRRVRFTSSVSYVVGNVNGGDVANSYGAWTGSGQFTVGLTRRLGLQTGYTYYQHNVGDAVQLFSHLPNHQRRQTVYAGLTFGLPLIRERIRTGR